MLVSFVLFHITSSQRLNRFFNQQKYIKQGEQMTKVLNSQNDAIIAFECIKEAGFCILNFLYQNIKCMELFQYDFVRQ